MKAISKYFAMCAIALLGLANTSCMSDDIDGTPSCDYDVVLEYKVGGSATETRAAVTRAEETTEDGSDDLNENKIERLDLFVFNGTTGNELIITMQNDYPVPRRISHKLNDFSLMISPTRTSIRVPIYEGELHYFYPNYKDYYYLPEEDLAIHKSVASFVDRQYRENARAYNCYNRKTSSFLPQCSSIMQPEFRKEYNDRISYFELTEDFCSSDVMLRRYVDHILKYMFETKK